MTSPQTFCEKLGSFLMSFRYGNETIIYEDRHGIMGKGIPIGLCISNREINASDFERARARRLKVLAENTSFGLKVFIVPDYPIRAEDIPRLIHCSGPPLYTR